MKLSTILRYSFSILQKREQKKYKALLLFNCITSLADIFVMIFLLAVVSLYTLGKSHLAQWLPAFFLQANSLLPIACLLVLIALKNLMGYFVFRAQSRFVFRVATRLSREQLLRYLNGSFEQYTQKEKGALINHVNHEPIEFAQHILTGIQVIVAEAVVATLSVTAILLFKPTLFLLLLILLFPPVLFAAYFVKKRLNNVKEHILDDAEKTNQRLDEAFHSYVESHIYDKQHFFARRHGFFQDNLSRHLSDLQIAQWIPSRLVEVFAVFGLFLLIIIGQKMNYPADILHIGAFIAAAYKIIPGIVRIANMNALIHTYQHTILDLQPLDITAAPHNQERSISSIRIQDLSFSYSGKSIFQHLNITFEKGDLVWISGPSGKGKSTFVNLLLGFLIPHSGKILINGTACNDKELQGYRHLYSYVKQQTFLASDTILHNITLSDEEPDTKRLEKAIAQTGLSPLLAALPEGLNTQLTGNGKNISGGQRQRIAIARALYNDASVILLDEPFNELDEASEKKLLQTFRDIAESGKIVLLLSHSPSSEAYCHKKLLI